MGYTGYMTDRPTGSGSYTSARGDTDRRSLADKYRPYTFAKVVGQESAVACLSGLIARNRTGRNILLHGAVGSGKTTLARIYARALNCQAADPRHSPCYDCSACGRSDDEPISEFIEFNVRDYGLNKEEFNTSIAVQNRPPDKFRFRVVFFDEAHALSRDQCDALLQVVERPEHPVVFLFATTEAEKLRPALRSRLFDLLIRPLPVDRAITFLTGIAKEEHIEHEPGALALLASLRTGFPRDLLLGLERVWEGKGSILTVQKVRDAFDIDQTEIVIDYFMSLADGDRHRATVVAANWRESETDKIRWIQAFLLHVYHNDILGRRLIVDGGIEAIPGDVRADIVRRFRHRLDLADPSALAPFWRRLMDFWPIPETAMDEPALGLRLALFHELAVAGGVEQDTNLAAKRARPVELAEAITSMAEVVPSSGFGPPPAPYPGERILEDKAGFLTKTDVRRIVNGASFLTQEYGILFNAAFEIRPAPLVAGKGEAAAAAVAAFRADLTAAVEELGGEVSASIAVLERVDGAISGRLVTHLRMLASTAANDTDRHRMEAWVRAWGNGAGRPGGNVVEVAWALEGEPAALRFHWKHVLGLCGGLDSRVEAWDPALGEHRPLLRLLRVPVRPGSRGPVRDHALVEMSAELCDAAIARRCGDRLEPLSAFDDAAWGEVGTGWELAEFDERQRMRIERAQRLDEVRQRFAPDMPEAEIETMRVVASWPRDPRQRRRRWRGWRAGRAWP